MSKPVDTLRDLKVLMLYGDEAEQAKKINSIYYFHNYDHNSVGVFGDDANKKFESLVNKLYSETPEISKNYTVKNFELKIVDQIRTSFVESKNIELKDWQEILIDLNSKPLEKIEIFAPIHGIILNQSLLKITDFTIYNFDLCKPYLTQKYPHFFFDHYKENYLAPYMISLEVEAKDSNKCIALAMEAFERFEYVANFILKDFHKNRLINIFHVRASINLNTVFISEKYMGNSVDHLGRDSIVDIKNDFFKDEKLCHERIWKLILKKRNTLENRLFLAIEWMGKALSEFDNSKAFLLAMIAIESLLQQEKGEFLTPSISNQISEFVSFLLGENLGQRLSLVKEMKRYYGIRSKIAHGESNQINQADLFTLLDYGIKIIYKILNETPFSEYASFEMVHKFIQDIKFS